MSRSLNFKLVRAFVLVIVFGTFIASVLTYWMTIREFNQFVFDQAQSRFISDVSIHYQANGSWDGVLEILQLRASAPQLPPRNLALITPQAPQPNQSGNQPPFQPPFIFGLVDQNGMVVVPAGDFRLGDQVLAAELAEGTLIEVDGQMVGNVLATGSPPALDPREQNYLTRTNLVLLYSGLAAVAVAIVIGILLARSLTRPLSELTEAIRKVTKGDLKQQVPVRSRDELGDLAAAFNQMSADLDKANSLRRQMTADIAHDLSTPLTVLSGYIEAMQAGTLEPSQERLETLKSEIQQLVRLVADLRTLSLADAGELSINRQQVEPPTFLESVRDAFQVQAGEKNIVIEVKASASLPSMFVDLERMKLVIGNLVSNALRFTPQDGQITLIGEAEDGWLLLSVQDNGPGIAPETLPFIFERFFRGDDSRQQTEGESGLGLAIARSIVELHGGKISVESVLGNGTKFTIKLLLGEANN